MQNENMIVQFRKPERTFTKAYNDFLDNEVLTCEEKMVFITLRSFANYAHDEADAVYPKLETICRRASMSRPRAIRTINKLVSKGIVQKKRRGLTKSNMYTLIDSADIWKYDSAEDMRQEAEKSDIQKHIEALEAAGYTVTKKDIPPREVIEAITALEAAGYTVAKKEKELSPTGIEESPNKSIQENTSSQSDTTTECEKRQECSHTSKCSIEEVYALENLKDYFEYRSIQADEATKEAIFNIIHNVLTSSKAKVKICGELRPAAMVKSRIMKLSGQDIQFVIEKYIEYGRKGRKIENPEAFILSQLYKAKEQAELETQNDLNVDGY